MGRGRKDGAKLSKLVGLAEAERIRTEARNAGRQVVFTNGCFDLLHRGHVEYLARARAMGDMLFVGLNSDRAVRSLKGDGRPIVREVDRAAVLSALSSVDCVVIFDDPTPISLISALMPDVLAKGGDWPVEKIVGRDVVEAAGGEVVSIESSVPHYSSSELHKRLLDDDRRPVSDNSEGLRQDKDSRVVFERLCESASIKREAAESMSSAIAEAARVAAAALGDGKKLLLCGNGGSAADAQHIAAELVGRFEVERSGLRAIALTTDTSILTAVGNDYGFEEVFARQLLALADEGDVLVVISTSGNSQNIVRVAESAQKLGIKTIGLLGNDGGRVAGLVDVALIVPSANVARIQETHITIGHIMCELIENKTSRAQ